MDIILKANLDHQRLPVEGLASTLQNVDIIKSNNSYSNPIFDTQSAAINKNIKLLQEDIDYEYTKNETSTKDYLNIDIRMETGTGKTYVYTKSILELNKKYGFNKFIIVVPSIPIKAGVLKFLRSDYTHKHFKNACGYSAEIKVHTVETMKKKKGKNYVPDEVREFATASNLYSKSVHVLVVNMQHLKQSNSGVLVRRDYDSQINGFYKPIDAIASTKPIVIIDEPHRFDRDKATFKFIQEQLKPQMLVRYGATFLTKEIGKGKNKRKKIDFQNLIYNLDTKESFSKNLIKGLAKEHVENSNSNATVIKILSTTKGESARFQKRYIDVNNEVKKETKELKPGDSLIRLSENLSHLQIVSISSSKILLSNGEEKVKGDEFFSDVFATSYIRESIKLALKRHFEVERENFKRKFKIKTLALFFIDDIHSYRDKKEKKPYLKEIFEEELSLIVEKEIQLCNSSEDEYKSYLITTLKNISDSHLGYFSEDNSTKDEDIEKQVNFILHDKESLLSLEHDDGSHNIKRFIFSKWTLKEGWDNPNIFTIAKLRSSGSDESRLQEIGRGLRLPVDETGNRIENELFYLNYIVDFTEANFVNELKLEIYGDNEEKSQLEDSDIEKLSKLLGKSENEVFIELLSHGYIQHTKEIIMEKYEEFIEKYPMFFSQRNSEPLKDRNKDKDIKVRIRNTQFEKIKNLWTSLNQKYYLNFDVVDDSVLKKTLYNVLEESISKESYKKSVRELSSVKNEQITFNTVYTEFESFDQSLISYGSSLKRLSSLTNLSIELIHETFIEFNKVFKLEKSFFTIERINLVSELFKNKIYKELLKVFSYKIIENGNIHPTQLTEVDGSQRDFVKTSTYLGTKTSEDIPMEKYLYDTVIFDSNIEENNIKNDIEMVEVFGKIPKNTLRIPFIDGSTYTPDFMYLIKDKQGKTVLNLVIESKGVDDDNQLRGTELSKIGAAEKVFDLLKSEGVSVSFKKQINKESVYEIIKGLMNE